MIPFGFFPSMEKSLTDVNQLKAATDRADARITRIEDKIIDDHQMFAAAFERLNARLDDIKESKDKKCTTWTTEDIRYLVYEFKAFCAKQADVLGRTPLAVCYQITKSTGHVNKKVN